MPPPCEDSIMLQQARNWRLYYYFTRARHCLYVCLFNTLLQC